MPVTLRSLLDTSHKIVEQSGLSDNNDVFGEGITNIIDRIIGDGIIEQIGLKGLLKSGEKITFEDDKVVNNNTLLSMYAEFEMEVKGGDIFANFGELIDEEDLEIFNNLLSIYYEYLEEGVAKEIKKSGYLKKLKKSSPLYKLFVDVSNGKDITSSMLEILKNNGIDININPKVNRPPEVEKCISDFKAYMLGLISTPEKTFMKETSTYLN
nr:hypothetical protein [Candidatus Gracilibacteria bacterium]